jgi:hypothetical protein
MKWWLIVASIILFLLIIFIILFNRFKSWKLTKLYNFSM